MLRNAGPALPVSLIRKLPSNQRPGFGLWPRAIRRFRRTAEPTLWDAVRVCRHFPLLPGRPEQHMSTIGLLELTTSSANAADRKDAGDVASLYAAEKHFGRGRVVLLGGPLDLGLTWNNILVCPPQIPAIHELIYYLSAPMRVELNVPAGEKLVIPYVAKGATATLSRPDGKKATFASHEDNGRLVFESSPLTEPGVYELRLSSTDGAAVAASDDTAELDAGPLYVTVQRDAAESETAALAYEGRDSDCQKVVDRLGGRAQFHQDTPRLLAAMQIRDPGREIWKWLAAAVLGVAVPGDMAVVAGDASASGRPGVGREVRAAGGGACGQVNKGLGARD